MHRIASLLVALLLGAVSLAPIRADDIEGPIDIRIDRPFEIDAEECEYEAQREVYVCTGNVVIEQGKSSLRADWMAFNTRTNRGVASGNVVYDDASDVIYAEFVEFEIDTLLGSLFEVEFRSKAPQFRIEGGEVRKTGEDTYRFEKGVFTTCRCPEDGREPWKIKAGESDLRVGGYGTARNTTIEVLGVPVVWLPYMAYPIKTERETGILFPEFGISDRNGFELGLPLFWAARENLNVTVTPNWLSKRGFKGDVDVEWLPGERNEFQLRGAFLYDNEIDPNSSKDPFDRERWQVGGIQDWFLPGDVRVKADFQFLSDNEYPVDFDDARARRTDRFVESAGFAMRSFTGDGTLGLSAGARFADDMQNPDDQDRDLVLLQRLPEARFDALPFEMPWVPHVVPTLGAQWIRFDPRSNPTDERPFGVPPSPGVATSNGAFLDTGIDSIFDTQETGAGGGGDPNSDNFATDGGPEGDGVFQEGEVLADRGNRVTLTPRLGSPWRIADLFEFYPEVGWYQTLYGSNNFDFEQRGLLTARADLRTTVRGRIGSVTHLLTPQVGWAFVWDRSQGSNPLYVPATEVPQRRIRQLSLDNVTLDPADRIPERNALTFGFHNRFYGGGEGSPVLHADFTILAGYEFADSQFGDLLLDGRAYLFKNLQARFNAVFDLDQTRFREGLASLFWEHQKGWAFAFSYRYLRDVPRFFEDFQGGRFSEFDDNVRRVNQIFTTVRIPLFWRFTGNYSVAYDFQQSILLRNQGGLDYVSKCRCWAAGFELRQERERGLSFNFVYKFTGLGKDTGYRGPSQLSLQDISVMRGF